MAAAMFGSARRSEAVITICIRRVGANKKGRACARPLREWDV